jgi:predicted CopG family antitoxin
MLSITLDEAYVFDILSIHEVKIHKSGGEKRDSLIQTREALAKEISNQIGEQTFSEIISSEVYGELKKANSEVFDLVDRASESELAKLTAEANYKRYIKKTELQSTFFNNQLSEVKI